jgi:hypothetical protein
MTVLTHSNNNTSMSLFLCFIYQFFFRFSRSLRVIDLNCSFSGVRGAALACMGPLIECAASYVKKNNGDRRLVKELFDFVINKILGALPKEINPELTAIGTSAIHEVGSLDLNRYIQVKHLSLSSYELYFCVCLCLCVVSVLMLLVKESFQTNKSKKLYKSLSF